MGKNRDGLIFGAIAGGLATLPQLSEWIADKMGEILPASIQIFGSYSIPIYGIVIGALIGFWVDRT